MEASSLRKIRHSLCAACIHWLHSHKRARRIPGNGRGEVFDREPRFIEAVRGACVALRDDSRLESMRDLIAARLDELNQPLLLAVSGHVSAGKSTMVNALLGRRLADTGVGETTMVNSWFVRGRPERVRFLRTSGQILEVPLPEAGAALAVPEDLDRDALQPITHFVDEPLLDDLTLIDTPGLFSPNSENSERNASADRSDQAGISECQRTHIPHSGGPWGSG